MSSFHNIYLNYKNSKPPQKRGKKVCIQNLKKEDSIYEIKQNVFFIFHEKYWSCEKEQLKNTG